MIVNDQSSLSGLNVASDFACRQLTPSTYITGVATIDGGANTVTVSTAAVSDDTPILVNNYKPQDPASMAIVAVDSVVDGVSFAIRANVNVESASPVAWMVLR